MMPLPAPHPRAHGTSYQGATLLEEGPRVTSAWVKIIQFQELIQHYGLQKEISILKSKKRTIMLNSMMACQKQKILGSTPQVELS